MLIAAGPTGVGKSWIACSRGSGFGGGDLRVPIEGAIVTIDAIGTQKAIAKKIIDGCDAARNARPAQPRALQNLEMPAQSVERRRALAGEQLAGPVAHQFGLFLNRTHRHEPLARPTRRLANRRRVGRVILVPAHIRLHMRRRDQPHLEAERQQLPRPVMGRRTSLHRHNTRRQLSKEGHEPAARELAPRRSRPYQLPSALPNLVSATAAALCFYAVADTAA